MARCIYAKVADFAAWKVATGERNGDSAQTQDLRLLCHEVSRSNTVLVFFLFPPFKLCSQQLSQVTYINLHTWQDRHSWAGETSLCGLPQWRKPKSKFFTRQVSRVDFECKTLNGVYTLLLKHICTYLPMWSHARYPLVTSHTHLENNTLMANKRSLQQSWWHLP